MILHVLAGGRCRVILLLDGRGFRCLGRRRVGVRVLGRGDRFLGRKRSTQGVEIESKRIPQDHHALEVLQHTFFRHIQGWPLGPVPGVIHEGLHLIMTEHGQVVHVMGDGYALNGEPAVSAVVHPSRIVGLHLERVDEGGFVAMIHQVLGKSIMAIVRDHLHDLFGRAQSCRTRDVRHHLGVEAIVGHPADLGALHRIPEPDSDLIVPPGLCVVGHIVGKSPSPDFVEGCGFESSESAKAVVGQQGFRGNGCSPAHQTIVSRMVAAVGEAVGGQVDEVSITDGMIHMVVGVRRGDRGDRILPGVVGGFSSPVDTESERGGGACFQTPVPVRPHEAVGVSGGFV